MRRNLLAAFFFSFHIDPLNRSLYIPHFLSAPVAQLDRAPDYESGGFRFDS